MNTLSVSSVMKMSKVAVDLIFAFRCAVLEVF